MKFLMILNDTPYGIERSYNKLRIAGMPAKREGLELRIFLIGDAVITAVSGQKVPAGHYNAQVMLGSPPCGEERSWARAAPAWAHTTSRTRSSRKESCAATWKN